MAIYTVLTTDGRRLKLKTTVVVWKQLAAYYTTTDILS